MYDIINENVIKLIHDSEPEQVFILKSGFVGRFIELKENAIDGLDNAVLYSKSDILKKYPELASYEDFFDSVK